MITYSVFMMQFLRKLRFFMFHETMFEKNVTLLGMAVYAMYFLYGSRKP